MAAQFPTKKSARYSILSKFFRLVMGVYLFAALIITSLQIVVEYFTTRDHILNELDLYQRGFGPALAGALWDLDSEEIASIAKGMAAHPDIIGVHIQDPKTNRLLFKTGHTPLVVDDTGVFSSLLGQQPLLKRFDIVYQHERGAEILGVLTLYSDRALLWQRLHVQLFMIIGSALLKVVILWFIFLWFGEKLIIRPLNQLSGAADRMRLETLGTVQVDAEIPDDNELKRLETAFNLMADQLHQGLSRQEQLNQRNLELLQLAVDESNLAFFLVDQKNRIMLVNKGAESVTGYAANALSDRLLSDFLQSPQITDWSLLLAETPVDRAQRLEGSFSRIKPEQSIPVEVSLRRVGWEKTPRYFVCVLDLSIHKEAQQKLLEAQQKMAQANVAKTQFLANMSHEIRTPMNVILGMCHLVMQTHLTDKQRGYMDKIQLGAERLLGLINNVLDLFRLESGQLRLADLSFYLDDLLDKLAKLLGPEAESKGVELLFSHALPPGFALRGDADRLEQILFNLIDNAIKFTGSQQRVVVKVTLEKARDHVVALHFSIADTGIGMSKEQIDHLFQPFYQGDASSTRKVGGAGLGLSVSRNLVKLMGGSLQVESALDQGSVFSFQLALARSSHQVEKKVSMDDLNGLRALVVDDNEGAREIFKEMLQNLGVQITMADSGLSALKRLRECVENPFDFILLDWRMPELDGIDTAREIQQDATLPSIPIILVSAFGRERAMRAASEVTLAGICQKPVTPTELLTIVGKAVSIKVSQTADLSTQSGEKSPFTPSEIKTLNALLLEWMRLLEQGNAQAANMLPQIRQQLGDRFRRPLDRAARQIEEYDFEDAAETVATIQDALAKMG
ncbi:ATP-binding protein [Magnetococcales bacterium HHB-1]